MKKHTQQPKENQQVFPVVELSSETSPEFTELSDSESTLVSGGAIGPGIGQGNKGAIQFIRSDFNSQLQISQ